MQGRVCAREMVPSSVVVPSGLCDLSASKRRSLELVNLMSAAVFKLY